MRILHTSDWHLGRQFHGLSLDDDHEHILVQILAMIDDERPYAVIIAGDIFDRANPPQSAITRLSQFLTTVRAASDAAIVIIAGNHESAAQIGAMGVVADGGAAIVRGPLDEDERPLGHQKFRAERARRLALAIGQIQQAAVQKQPQDRRDDCQNQKHPEGSDRPQRRRKKDDIADKQHQPALGHDHILEYFRQTEILEARYVQLDIARDYRNFIALAEDSSTGTAADPEQDRSERR